MLASSISVMAAVLRTPLLVRLLGGFTLFSICEWASWIAIAVYAFDRGGATETAIVGAVMGLPTLLIAPAGGLLGDRWPRARVLLGSYLLQALAMAIAAVALAAGASLVAYAAAVLMFAAVALTRPTMSSLLPEVVESPDALTAANVAAGLAEGIGALAGPLAAGLVLVVGGSAGVYAASSVALLVAAFGLFPIARASLPVPIIAGSTAGADPGDDTGSMAQVAQDLVAGIRAITSDRRLASVFALLTASSMLLGAVGVFIIVIAIELLGLDDSVAAYLTAASGLGALAGSALSVTLVGRDRLGRPLVIGAAVFGVFTLVLAVVSTPVVIAGALVAGGIGYAFVYVAATTLIQRLAGDDVMNRVFGVAESATMGGEALGALIVPVLIAAFGPAGAIAAAGIALPIVAILAAPAFIRSDRAEAGLLAELRAIRSVPMFRPLAAPVVERLAAGAVPVTIDAGSPVVREGDIGERFYVVMTGRAEVDVGGIPTGTLGGGDSFGEIALLHDIPRTATVRAIEPMTLLAIDRAPFLEALTGQPRSHALADQLATRRLARDPGVAD